MAPRRRALQPAGLVPALWAAVAVALALLLAAPVAAQPAHFADAFGASGIKPRTFTTREYFGIGPICMLNSNASAVHCWNQAGVTGDVDRSWSLNPVDIGLPMGTTWISVAMALDVWLLASTGHLVMVLNAGSMRNTVTTASTGDYAPWPYPLANTAFDATQIGILPGPYVAFDVYPDAGSTRGRDVCAVQAFGDLECFSLSIAPATTSLAAVPGVPSSSRPWDLRGARVASAMFCPAGWSGPCSSYGSAGPFTSVSFVAFTSSGMPENQPAPSTSYAGQGRWALVCGNTVASGVRCAGTLGFGGGSDGLSPVFVPLPGTVSPGPLLSTPGLLRGRVLFSTAVSCAADSAFFPRTIGGSPAACFPSVIAVGVAANGTMITERTDRRASSVTFTGGQGFGFGAVTVDALSVASGGVVCGAVGATRALGCASLLTAAPTGAGANGWPVAGYSTVTTAAATPVVSGIPQWLSSTAGASMYGFNFDAVSVSDQGVCGWRREGMADCVQTEGGASSSIGRVHFPFIPAFGLGLVTLTAYPNTALGQALTIPSGQVERNLVGLRGVDIVCIYMIARSGSLSTSAAGASVNTLRCYGGFHAVQTRMPAAFHSSAGIALAFSKLEAGQESLAAVTPTGGAVLPWGNNVTAIPAMGLPRSSWLSNMQAGIITDICVGPNYYCVANGNSAPACSSNAPTTSNSPQGVFTSDPGSNGFRGDSKWRYVVCGDDWMATMTPTHNSGNNWGAVCVTGGLNSAAAADNNGFLNQISGDSGQCYRGRVDSRAYVGGTTGSGSNRVIYYARDIIGGGHILCIDLPVTAGVPQWRCYQKGFTSNELNDALSDEGVPVPSNTNPQAYRYISVGFRHVCVVGNTGKINCATADTGGSTQGVRAVAFVPSRAAQLDTFISVAAMALSTCALTTTSNAGPAGASAVVCWGPIASAVSRSLPSAGLYASLASSRVWTVGKPGSSSASCTAATRDCTSLNEALARMRGMGSRIEVYLTTTTTGAVTIDSTFAGLTIVGMYAQPSAILLSEPARGAATAHITVSAEAVTFRNLAFVPVGSTSTWADTGIAVTARGFSMVNVNITNLVTRTSIVRVAQPSLPLQLSGLTLPPTSDDDFSLDNFTCVQCRAVPVNSAFRILDISNALNVRIDGLTATLQTVPAGYKMATLLYTSDVPHVAVRNMRAVGFTGPPPVSPGASCSFNAVNNRTGLAAACAPGDYPVWQCGSLVGMETTTWGGGLTLVGDRWSLEDITGVGALGAVCVRTTNVGMDVSVQLSNVATTGSQRIISSGPGGFLYAASTASNVRVSVTNATFGAGVASGYAGGGGFFVSAGGAGQLTVAMTNVSASTAVAGGGDGGLLAASGPGTVVLSGVSVWGSSTATGSGGVVAVSSASTVSIDRMTVVRASSPWRGGGIAVTGVDSLSLSNVALSNVAAGTVGGAVSLQDTNALWADLLTVVNGTAGVSGGGIHVLATDAADLVFPVGAPGPSLLSTSAPSFSVALSASQLQNCTAVAGDGGAIALASTATGPSTMDLSLQASSLAFCRAGMRGGCISLSATMASSMGLTASLARSSIALGTAAAGGGGIAFSLPDGAVGAAALSLVSSNVTGCSATAGPGGGIFAPSTAVSLLRSTLSMNNAGSGGGGGLYAPLGSAELTASLLTNNAAQGAGGHGGAVFLSQCLGSGLRFRGAVWSAPPAAVLPDWGSISGWLSDFPWLPEVLGTVFLSNTAGGSGGGVYVADCAASFNYTVWVANTARAGSGGAICVDSAATSALTFGAVVAAGNTAGGQLAQGGAVAVRRALVPIAFGPAPADVSALRHGAWLARALAYASRWQPQAAWLALSMVTPVTAPSMPAAMLTYGAIIGVLADAGTGGNASVAFVGNSAPLGGGGDIGVAPAPGYGGSLSVVNLVSVGSSAGVAGGSIDVMDLSSLSLRDSIFNGTASTSLAGVPGGNGRGGALSMTRVVAHTLSKVAFARCRAVQGGAIWLLRLSSAPTNATALWAPSADAPSWNVLVFDSNAALRAGGDLFLDLGDAPDCMGCYFLGASTSGGYGPSIATSTRNITSGALSSPYWKQTGGAGSPYALVIVGGSPVALPVFSVQLRDAYGGLVTGDNGTTCNVVTMNEFNVTYPPVSYPSTYGPAANGLVGVFPYSLGLPVDSAVWLHATCTTGEGRQIWGTVSAPAYTSAVVVAFSAATRAGPIYILTSTKTKVNAPPRNVELQLLDGSLSPMPTAVSCSIGVQSAKDSNNADVTAVSLIQMTQTTSGGTASFPVAFQTSSGVTITLSGYCMWKGAAISASTTVQLITVPILAAWGPLGPLPACPTGSPKCVDATAVGAPLTGLILDAASSLLMSQAPDGSFSTYVSSKISAGFAGEGAMVPLLEALPSSSVSVLPLEPAPTVTIIRDTSTASVASFSFASTDVPCSVFVESSWAASRPAYAGDAIMAGTATVTTVASTGTATFTSLGLRNVGFGALVPLIAQCQWPTGELISSIPFIVRTKTLSVAFATAPATTVLASGPIASSLVPMPTFSVALTALSAASVGTVPPPVPATGASVPCQVSLQNVVSTGFELPALVGSTQVFSDPATGVATFNATGLYAGPGTTAKLQVTCTWVSGHTVSVLSSTLTVSALRVVFTTQPPAYTAASGPVASLALPMSPFPAVQLQAQDGNSVWQPVTGYAIACSADVNDRTPNGASSAPVLVGTLSADADPSTGIATFDNLGVSAPLQAVAELSIACRWRSGASITGVSSTVTMSPISVTFAQPPPALVLASGPTSSTLVPLTPAPAIKLQATNPLTSTTLDLLNVRVPCTFGVSSSDASVQLVGTTDTSTDPTTGLAAASNLGVYGPSGATAQITVQCTWLSGSIVTGSSVAFQLSPLSISFTTQPPLAAVPSGPSPDSWVYLPFAPVFQLAYTAPSGSGSGTTTVPLTGRSVPCSASVVVVNARGGIAPTLVGTSEVSTDGSTGLSSLPAIGFTGSVNASVAVSVRCTWISGSTATAQSRAIVLAPLQVTFGQLPPSVLASGPTATTRVPMVTQPTLTIAGWNAEAGAYVPVSGYRVPCSLSAELWPPASGTVQLVGQTDVVSSVFSAQLAYTGVGVIADSGASVRLVARCTWVSGAVFTGVSNAFIMSALRVSFDGGAQPPPLVRYDWPFDAAFVLQYEVIDAAGGRTWLNTAQGGTVACSASADVVDAAGGTAPMLTGGTDSSTAGGRGALQTRIKGNQNAVARLLTRCTWPSGSTFTGTSAAFRIGLLAISVSDPPLSILSSGPTPATLQVVSPSPVATLEEESGVDADGNVTWVQLTREIPCSLSVQVFPSSAGSAQLVGDGDARVDPATGTASFPGVGVFAPMGLHVGWVVRCTWLSGEVVTSPPSSTAVMSTVTASFSRQPGAFILSSGPSADTWNFLTPAPTFQLYYSRLTSATMSETLLLQNSPIDCSALPSVVDAAGGAAPSLVGTTTVTTNSSGMGLLSAIGFVGATNARVGIEMRCTWVTGEVVGAVSTPAQLSPLQVVVDMSPFSVLSSGPTSATLMRISPSPRVTVLAQKADRSGFAPALGVRVPCSLSAELWPPRDALAQVVGTPDNSTSTQGVAVFDRVGIFAPAGVSVRLVAQCTWVSGAVITGVSRAFNTSTFALSFVTSPSGITLGSGPTSDSWTFLAPAPAFQLFYTNQTTSMGNTTLVPLTGLAVPCVAQANVVDAAGGTSPQLVGSTGVSTDVSGRGALAAVGLTGNQGARAGVSVTCTWASGSTMSGSSPGFTTLARLRVNITAPPAVVVPGGPTTSQLVRMSPAPAVWLGATFGTGAAGFRPVFGLRIPCSLSVEFFPAFDAAIQLVGSTDNTTLADTGNATFERVSVYGPSGASVRLIATCTWFSGELISVPSAPFRLATLSLAFSTQPAYTVLPSGATSDAWAFLNPAPVVQLFAPSLTAGGALQSVPLGGFSVPCVASVNVTNAAGGSAPQLVGDPASSTILDGSAAFPQLGFTGRVGATVRVSVMCTWVSGASVSAYSTITQLAALQLRVSRAAQARILSSGADPATWRVMLPGPSIQAYYQVIDRFLATNYVPLSGYALPCTAAIATVRRGNVVQPTSSIQLVGVADNTTLLNGVATWDSIGLSGSLGLTAFLRFTCSFPSGATVSVTASTGTLMVAVLMGFSTQPPLTTLPGSVSGANVFPLVPSPVVQVYDGTLGLGDDNPAPSVRCVLNVNTVSAPTGNTIPVALAGATTQFTNPLTGKATFTGAGITGPLGAVVQLVATCTWISGDDVSVLANRTTLSNVRIVSAQAPPTLAIPSNPSAVTPWRPAPAIQLQVDARNNGTWLPLRRAFSLTCILALRNSTRPAGSTQRVALQGETSAVTNVNGTAVFPNVGSSGPYNSYFDMTYACPWINGQSLGLTTARVQFPAPNITWAMGSVLPAYVLYNTPMEPVRTTLTFTVLSPSGRPGPVRTDWAAIGIQPGDIRCAMSAAVQGSTASVLLTGAPSVAADANGTATFADVGFVPPTPQESDPDQVLLLAITCSIRGQASGVRVTGKTIVQRLTTAFLQAPPPRVLPSSQTSLIPFSPPVSIAVFNATGGLLEEDGVVCVMAIKQGSVVLPPGVPSTSPVTLLGNARAGSNAGIATFPGIAVSAPFGTSLNLTVTCSRQQGGLISMSEAGVSIDVVRVAWGVKPPSFILQSTGVAASIAVTSYEPDTEDGFRPLEWTNQTVAGVPCSLFLEPVVTTPGDPRRFVSLASAPPEVNTVSDDSGEAHFRVSVSGIPTAQARLFAVCTVGGQSQTSTTLVVTIDTVMPVFQDKPPRVWLPSSGLAQTPVVPAPSVTLIRLSDRSPVDARGAVCRLGVDVPDSVAQLINLPVAGFKMSVSVDVSAAADAGDPAAIRAVTTTPIPLTDITIVGSFGGRFNLTVTCTRSQGDASAVLSWSMRFFDLRMRWRVLPPSVVVSQRGFQAAIELYDQQLHAAALANASMSEPVPQAQGGEDIAFLPDSVRQADIVTADSVSQCLMDLTSTGGDSNVFIQNNDGVSSHGVVTFKGTAVTARSGSIVGGTATCSLGSLRIPGTLTWSMQMQPCPVGFAPAGDGGYTCAVCPNGFYSDGGVGAKCVKCPQEGVQCLGGILTFLPGFYRTPGENNAVVDENTEFRVCLLAEACSVQTDTMNRTLELTHSCMPGYSGPLCAVCDWKAGYARSGKQCQACTDVGWNYFVTAMFPLVFVLFAVWISLIRKQTPGNRVMALFRILMTYIQVIGTVGSAYVAQGTNSFRKAFGFSDAIGSSPFAIQALGCTLNLSYSARFSATVGLPFIIAAASLVINIIAIFVRHSKARAGMSRGAAAHSAFRKKVKVLTDKSHAAGTGASDGSDAAVAVANPMAAVAALEDKPADSGEGAAAAAPASGDAAPTSGAAAVAPVAGDAAAASGGVTPTVPKSPAPPAAGKPTEVAAAGPEAAAAGAAGAAAPDAENIVREQGILLTSDSPRPEGLPEDFEIPEGTRLGPDGLLILPPETPPGIQIGYYFLSQKWLAPVIFVLNVSYASITTTAFSVFNCQPYSIGGKFYLNADLRFECYTPLHDVMRLAAGVVIGLFAFGLPLFFALLLIRYRTQLTKPFVYSRFGFLYDGYSVERGLYWWESVVMMRKALVVCIGALIKDPWYQIVAAVTMLTISMAAQAGKNPFKSRTFNLLETTSISGLVCTLLISVFFLRYQTIAEPCLGAEPDKLVDDLGTTCAQVLAAGESSELATTAVLALINFGFLIVMAVLIIRAFVRLVGDKFKPFLIKLSKHPKLQAREYKRIRKLLEEYGQIKAKKGKKDKLALAAVEEAAAAAAKAAAAAAIAAVAKASGIEPTTTGPSAFDPDDKGATQAEEDDMVVKPAAEKAKSGPAPAGPKPLPTQAAGLAMFSAFARTKAKPKSLIAAAAAASAAEAESDAPAAPSGEAGGSAPEAAVDEDAVAAEFAAKLAAAGIAPISEERAEEEGAAPAAGGAADAPPAAGGEDAAAAEKSGALPSESLPDSGSADGDAVA